MKFAEEGIQDTVYCITIFFFHVNIMFFGIENFSAKSFWGVLLSSSWSTSYFNFNDLSEWERFAAMLIFLKTQLFAVLLQQIGAGKTSLTANHTFEFRKTAMQWLRLRKNIIWFFIVRSFGNLNPVLVSFVKFYNKKIRIIEIFYLKGRKNWFELRRCSNYRGSN